MFSHLDREVGPNHMDVNVLAMPLKEVKKGGECTQYGRAGGTFGEKGTGEKGKKRREKLRLELTLSLNCMEIILGISVVVV